MNNKKIFPSWLILLLAMCLGLVSLGPRIPWGKLSPLMAMQGVWQVETLQGKFPNGRIREFDDRGQLVVVVGPILYLVDDKSAAWLNIKDYSDPIAVDLRYSPTDPLICRPSIMRLSSSGRLEIVLGMEGIRPQTFDLDKERPGTVRVVLRKVW